MKEQLCVCCYVCNTCTVQLVTEWPIEYTFVVVFDITLQLGSEDETSDVDTVRLASPIKMSSLAIAELPCDASFCLAKSLKGIQNHTND